MNAVATTSRRSRVVASASYPTYDPQVWTGGISEQDYAELTDPKAGTPLVDRVTAATFPPASTFKVISVPAAIQAGNSLSGTYDCTSAFRIGDRDKHDRYRPCCLRRGERRLGADRKQDVRLERDELRRQSRQKVEPAVGEAMLDNEIALRTVAELLEPVEERPSISHACGRRERTEIPHAVNPLLGADSPRHGEGNRADEDRSA